MRSAGAMATSVGLWLAVSRAVGGGFEPDLAGIRVAFSATRLDDHFYQAEAYFRLESSGYVELGRDWRVQAACDFSAGVLGRVGEQDKGFVGGIGPVLSLSRRKFPVELVAGSSPTVLSRRRFGSVDFGTVLQFTSHLGLNARLSRRWSAAYRYQHMSNASFSPNNPGLDMHSLAFGYRF